MTKKPSELQKAIDDFGEAYVAMCVEFVKAMKPLLDKMKDVREAGGLDPFREPEIRIIEQGAIPAAYYYRPAVIEAIRQEILKDHKAGQPIPPGAELINQEEDAENGKTEKISDPENDSTKRGDGSEPPKDGSNDGDQNSGGGASDPGGESKDSPKTGTSDETPGEK